MFAALAGCDAPRAQFQMSRTFIAKQLGEELKGEGRAGRDAQLDAVNESLVAMFGTPDDPLAEGTEKDSELAAALGLSPTLNVTKLSMAAGPVGRDKSGFQRGLYRQHCVHCHGVTGDGRGPTAAFLNPYPRDFRMGKFKFKSTPVGERPTDGDLRKTLLEGIPGTAMPSFKVLPGDQIDALVNYVKYLAIRGETERSLVLEAAAEYEAEDKLDTSRELLVDIALSGVVGAWSRADDAVTTGDSRPSWEGEQLAASVARGKELFQGKNANCFSCHGTTALGDGQVGNYDDWTNDFAEWNAIVDPAERANKMAEYEALGGLTPRNLIPRNLRKGVYRGGRRPVDIYWRIRNGIEGALMPAATVKSGDDPDAPGLTEEDIWHLVDYVQAMPYETLSLPPEKELENLRANP
ncbi:MAG: cytochrome c [Planctomycetales bacterium]|nr:cytochrome c [Planctomycetales bacterium]